MFDEHVFFFSYSKNAISYKVKKNRKRRNLPSSTVPISVMLIIS